MTPSQVGRAAEFVELAAEALERLGAHDHLAILGEADGRVASEVDRLIPRWNHGLNGLFASYKVSAVPELDKQWFALPRLSAKLIAYIRQNVSEFNAAEEER